LPGARVLVNGQVGIAELSQDVTPKKSRCQEVTDEYTGSLFSITFDHHSDASDVETSSTYFPHTLENYEEDFRRSLQQHQSSQEKIYTNSDKEEPALKKQRQTYDTKTPTKPQGAQTDTQSQSNSQEAKSESSQKSTNGDDDEDTDDSYTDDDNPDEKIY
jgi:hypothetical protein